MSRATFATLAILISINAAADVVHFKNGDRLTGDRVAAGPGFVAINVQDLGVLEIPEARIARVQTTAEAGQPPEPTPAATSGISGLIDAWDVIADLAATTATGNTETSDLNFVASATRTGEHLDHVLGAAWHRGEVADVATSEQLLAKDQLDLNYDLRWKYKESWYAVASFEYFRDPIKDIDRRYTGGAGFGHTFWTSTRGTLSTDGGVSQVFEKLASVAEASTSESNPALRWSLSYQHWLAPERLELFHNNQVLHILASDRGTVWDSDTGLRLHVNGRWQAGVRLDLQHETTPAAGRGRTDLAYAVSLGVKL
ncbi:MAG: DUF481 domain-containing protein [Gammaproteobacteria bacterium]|nr:DUF481 domain-containing protein [Gammaproteobacteria bacterium]